MSSIPSPQSLHQQQCFSHTLQNFKLCMMCKKDFRNYKRHFSNCQHDLNICSSCYCKHIDEKIEKSEVITCPYCPTVMLLDSNQYSTFLKHMPTSKQISIRQYMTRKDSLIQLWQCSVKNCKGLIVHQICQECGQHYCAKCRQKQHSLETCTVGKNSSTAGSIETDGSKIICPKCDYINTISKKDKKKKAKQCENNYCNAILCVEHRVLWTKGHQSIHPRGKKNSTKVAECKSCVIY